MSARRLPRIAALFACGGLLLVSSATWARDPAAAEALFEQARAAMAVGSYDLACERFGESDALDPAVGTRFNLADCEERRGRLATALRLFDAVAVELPLDDDRRLMAQARARELAPRVARLRLTPQPGAQGSRVTLDGVELGEADWGRDLALEPGRHELLVQPRGGGAPERVAFAAKAGELVVLPLSPPAAGPAATPPPAKPTIAAEPSTRASRAPWALAAGGVGIAGVTLGTVAGVVTLDKKQLAEANCSDATQTCNAVGVAANTSGKKYAVLSAVGFGVGVAGLALGAYWWLTRGPATSPSASSAGPARGVVAEVTWGNDHGFVRLGGSF
jgi:hypothetical protein